MPLLLEFSQCNVEAISNVRVFMPAYNEKEKTREKERNGEIILPATGKGPLQRVFFPCFFFFLNVIQKLKNLIKTDR